jgi:hypothetical protein
MGGPVLVMIAVAVVAGLGLWLGWLWLRGRPRQPLVLGAHILLGLAAFETMIVTIQWVPEGATEGPTRLAGQLALGVMAVGVGFGLAGPLVAKDSRAKRQAMVAAHAGVGVVGAALAIVWAARL